MTGIHTCDVLIRDLRELGVARGDTLFIHASFKSLGPVAGGAETVVRALETAVGPNGLVLMPAFNLVEGQNNRAATWDIHRTPSTVGWLTEYFRKMPGTCRSDHYSHSVAARGKNAAAFVAGHLERIGYRSPWDRAPWGKTYGIHSPMMRAYKENGKLVMLGVDYETSTYAHLVEVRYWNERLDDDPEAGYTWLDRSGLGAFWDRTGHLNQGQAGDASCRCFGIRAYVDTLLAEVRRDPDAYDRAKLKHARGTRRFC